ncbi:DUF554 family protein [Thermanaerosceptrum fracticalcis]|uniref:DUF554 family protein n=1 Tax=Thermanaerosceptrum fracticalcis TaxID=1712410 RepID=A0A7G6E557_THEFR|nr:DUF554 domain-containing protein [Thermanaerosceptrum fracticalcis]QNB47211.1 DUF554 family protein [Thermanaerosceptrum fracticalcis]
MTGTIVNAAAIIAGAVVGLFLRTGIQERYKDIIMQGLGLSVLLIGMKMAFKTNNELLVILSLVIGAIIGEWLDIDRFLEALGQRLQAMIGSREGEFVRGFVSASLIYCVGAMAIMGPIESGLTGQHKVLYVKSALDGISAIIFSSTMGLGVAFSALPVFVYQGSITLLAGAVKALLTEAIIAELTATGGILIVAIGLNVLGIKQIKVANLLPAVLVVVILTSMVARFFPGLV